MFNLFQNKKSENCNKPFGQLGEELAQEEYKKQGFQIIAQNEFNKKGLRRGEVDFIAKNSKEIVFVEVKTRTGVLGKFGAPEDAVNVFKQRKILTAVKMYLLTNPEYFSLKPRIDVCVVESSQIDKTLKCAKIITNAVEDNF